MHTSFLGSVETGGGGRFDGCVHYAPECSVQQADENAPLFPTENSNAAHELPGEQLSGSIVGNKMEFYAALMLLNHKS